ncbi:hypothetical protein F5Y11DRAFT_302013 [Daldinia sp. FL1419]|nr:hypothetical protein F5Y11DRAFT_302013 [Daldinia sp. FL1419]
MRFGLVTAAFPGPKMGSYSQGKVTEQALVLDRVMEGQRLASRSKFLQLPSDILTDIVNLLIDDGSTLASLAQVNSDCRQLARSAQFAEIDINYANSRARELVSKLDQERISRQNNDNNGNKQGPTIGACIRRITTASYPDFIIHFMRDSHRSGKPSTELQEQALEQYKSIRARVQQTICFSLPNLEVIIWHDAHPMDISFFGNIMRSPARHLWLRRLPVARETMITFLQQPPIPSTWSLRTLVVSLYLELLPREPIQEDKDSPFRLVPARFFELLLRSCAPSIESLVWLLRNRSINDGPTPTSEGEPVSFPHLQFLRIGELGPPHSLLPSLFSAPLRHLSIDLNTDFDVWGVLANCGTFWGLETLVLQPLPEAKEHADFVADFISRHEQIRKLCISESTQAREDTAHLDTCIVPLFSTGRFEHLKTLSLMWGGGDYRKTGRYTISVSASSLAAIACLASLEELSLGAGTGGGPYCQWLVDHDVLRDILFKLKKLKGLALVHDAYPWEALSSSENVERYFGAQTFTDDEMTDIMARLDLEENPADLTRIINREGDEDERFDRGYILWEILHRNRMLKQTETWAAAFPSLEWTYFGQRLMGVREDPGDPSGKKVVPLSERRDDSCQFLVDTFTIAGFER